MINQTTTVKKLLSKQTVEKLDADLSKRNIEQLKKTMEKLFTFKNIFNMHDDHIIELAECIVDVGRADDRVQCAREIEQYARRRISRYQERKKQVVAKTDWAKVTKTTDKVAMLDVTYQQWVYESGFEYSKFQMYTMICNIMRDVQKYGKEGTK